MVILSCFNYVSYSFFFGFGNSSSVKAVIKKGQDAGTIPKTTDEDANTAPVKPATGTLSGKYLLAFHVRDISGGINSGSNANQFIYFVYSDDGLSWTPVPDFKPFSGSAPDIIRREDTVYFYTPDPDMVARYSISSKTLRSGTTVIITEQGGSSDRYGDVTPFLESSTGKIVLFYKSTKGYQGDPQYGILPVCSATEVAGSDGTRFTKDDGYRVTPSSHADSGIFYDGSRYLLYIGFNTTGPKSKSHVSVYSSTELRGAYTPLSTLPGGVLTESGSVPDGYYDSASGQYWTYITVLSPTGAAVIKRAAHSDFSRQLVDSDFTTIISNALYPGLKSTDSPESPGFTANER